jgi:hypothetical protein
MIWAILGIVIFVVIAFIGLAAYFYRDRILGPPTPSKDPTLVGYWSFDDVRDGRVADGSSRGNDSRLFGGRIADGVRRSGLQLDGQPDQYCEIPAGPDFDFAASADFTIAGWFRSVDPSGTILSLRHSTLPTQLEVLIRYGKLQAIVGDDGDNGRQTWVWGSRVIDGMWHHFALVRSAGIIELYLDGISQGRGAGNAGGGPITTDVRAVGCELLWVKLNDMRWGRPGFVGGIDEIYIFKSAFSASELISLMQR